MNSPSRTLMHRNQITAGLKGHIARIQTSPIWRTKFALVVSQYKYAQCTCFKAPIIFLKFLRRKFPFRKRSLPFETVDAITQETVMRNGIDRFKWQRPYTKGKLAEPPSKYKNKITKM